MQTTIILCYYAIMAQELTTINVSLREGRRLWQH